MVIETLEQGDSALCLFAQRRRAGTFPCLRSRQLIFPLNLCSIKLLVVHSHHSQRLLVQSALGGTHLGGRDQARRWSPLRRSGSVCRRVTQLLCLPVHGIEEVRVLLLFLLLLVLLLGGDSGCLIVASGEDRREKVSLHHPTSWKRRRCHEASRRRRREGGVNSMSLVCSFLLTSGCRCRANCSFRKFHRLRLTCVGFCRTFKAQEAEASELRERRRRSFTLTLWRVFEENPRKDTLRKCFPPISRYKAVSVFLSRRESLIFFLLRKQEMGRSRLAPAQSDSFQSFQRSIWKVGHPGCLAACLSVCLSVRLLLALLRQLVVAAENSQHKARSTHTGATVSVHETRWHWRHTVSLHWELGFLFIS